MGKHARLALNEVRTAPKDGAIYGGREQVFSLFLVNKDTSIRQIDFIVIGLKS